MALPPRPHKQRDSSAFGETARINEEPLARGREALFGFALGALHRPACQPPAFLSKDDQNQTKDNPQPEIRQKIEAHKRHNFFYL
ncbi:MAG: hypothetical protein A3C12_02980 [Candidatus Sungbacteria bacterium RIFCSPHIGHO2_02_FULL_49_20]|uniref:Uncharacterized protein n=1 Tax=Candidatus Sungbacteria bacterium RIFCSPHIGHO2_02_FULL_49_20 TaxID=1802272 RepID=A0A1G2KQ83_9BACT|nr:MAG: hypothetical protein A3C12_02980 [Candidatus Sungbacteria bacterium RIFCSPHIGHO2_02_FULL_49_20]